MHIGRGGLAPPPEFLDALEHEGSAGRPGTTSRRRSPTATSGRLLMGTFHARIGSGAQLVGTFEAYVDAYEAR